MATRDTIAAQLTEWGPPGKPAHSAYPSWRPGNQSVGPNNAVLRTSQTSPTQGM
jgi:hypothetical protein